MLESITWNRVTMASANLKPMRRSSIRVESIEVMFFPGSVADANTYTVASPVLFNTTAAAAVSAQLADVNRFHQAGMLELNILSKNYLRETPMIAFPPKANFALDAAYATNAAARG